MSTASHPRPGTGKTHLAVAVSIRACLAGQRVTSTSIVTRSGAPACFQTCSRARACASASASSSPGVCLCDRYGLHGSSSFDLRRITANAPSENRRGGGDRRPTKFYELRECAQTVGGR
jgi:hypothetical protein